MSIISPVDKLSNIFDHKVSYDIHITFGDITFKIPFISAQRAVEPYNSQWKQDFYIDRIFKKKTNGIFVDVGAHLTGDNSLYFEKHLNWTGICIEPQIELYTQLRELRSCVCFNACAYDKMEILDFSIVHAFDVLSGISSEFDQRHMKRIEDDKNKYDSHKETEVIKSLAMPLQWFMDSCKLTEIDFLSIDTEGSEFSVIKGIDFNKTKIKVIIFEDNYIDKSIPIVEYLVRKDYLPIIRIGGDILMMNRDFYNSL